MSFKGYERPQFDSRVKHILAIDNGFKLVKKALLFLIGSMLLIGLFGAVARAESTEDMFMVPIVKLTGSGAAVIQPQTGAGYDALNRAGTVNLDNKFTTADDSSYEGLDNGYIAPKHDPFITGTANQSVPLPESPVKEFGDVQIRVTNNLTGGIDPLLGTTNTTFNFSAYLTDTRGGYNGLEYRWDFDGDNQFDSYFSKIATHSHVYKLAGDYRVTVQVLDNDGVVHSATTFIKIVDNEAPRAVFVANKTGGPINSIVRFNTELSSDSQHAKSTLKYRFDFDGDNKFDTNFQNKTNWAHQYREVGTFTVKMQVIDPEGLTDTAEMNIDISEDTAPEARLSIERTSDFNYRFDASMSSDVVTPLNKLKFRWDFNYTGNNDIVFDTNWSSSPRQTGSYRIGGSKTVRLQVMDEQGLISESYAQIEVPWTENLVNLAVGML
ncbi:PKD domain-containing protein [Candidatus Peregrinibacteria bacterium]|nr:PKD domain-containing protein [Candidatus Peregrinibacteria bacterium]